LNTPPISSEAILQSASKEGVFTKSKSDDVDSKIVELPENLSILFVDDDLVLRKLFSRSVAKTAPTWKIQEAANGETALELVDSEPYDLIFMDQYMTSTEKQMLGTDTVRALRAKGYKNRICGLSANDMEQTFISAGADCFILKPIPCNRSALEGVLDGILSSSRRPISVLSIDEVTASPGPESDD
jgi:CheY-like chemotaxis protein